MSSYDDPDPHKTPGAVVAAAAAATVVVPFLVVYSFLFLARGIFVQVEQPDITNSRTGEALAGCVALLFLVLVVWGMVRLLNGSSRWIFWLGQVLTAAASIDFLLDASSGDPQVPVVMLLASLLAVGLSVTPAATRWVRSAGGEHPVGPPVRPEAAESADRPAGTRHSHARQG